MGVLSKRGMGGIILGRGEGYYQREWEIGLLYKEEGVGCYPREREGVIIQGRGEVEGVFKGGESVS